MKTDTTAPKAPPAGGSVDSASLDCEGYRKLVAAVERDEKVSPNQHRYRGKLGWIVARAKHYADKTGLTPETLLNAWEAKRDYWYMNYYQDSNQPLISADSVRVFGTVEELGVSIGDKGFRCPSCAGVSKSPYECDTGIKMNGAVCDWKSYGLFGHLGKGISVFVKEKVQVQAIFMPVAWEVDDPSSAAAWPQTLKRL